MSVFGIGFEIRGLDLFTDKLSVFRDQIAFQEFQIAFRLLLRELLAFDLLLQYVEQMHRVGGHFGMVEVKHAREDFKGEARRQAVHAFVHACVVTILLVRLGFRIGIFQAFAIVDAHFRVDARVFRLFQARQNRKARQRFQGARGAWRMGQLTVVEQFFIDADLFGDTQAIRHLDDIDAVEEGLIVLVITEGHPFRFVGVSKDDPVKRQGGDPFGAVIVTFLGGGQQRMQHLNRRFKHLDEFHDPLVGAAQRAGVAVSVRVVLRVVLQFTDIDFTDQRRDILVVFVARFGFGNRNLFQNGRPYLHHTEFGDVAAKLVQAFRRPRRHDGSKIAGRHAVLFFQNLRVFLRVKQAQRMVVNRAAFAISAQHINRHPLHQGFQSFSQR